MIIKRDIAPENGRNGEQVYYQLVVSVRSKLLIRDRTPNELLYAIITANL